jgi:predicted DNA-binding protein with PD1-like motif
MKTFRAGTAAELIPFRLDDAEDLVPTLARMSEDLNLGTAAVVMASGALGVARLLPAGTAGPAPLGVIAEHDGPLAILSMQGWILANQPELHLTLARGAAVIAGRAVPGCLVQGSVEGLLLRLGNVRLSRLSDPASGGWTLSTTALPQDLPQFQIRGRPIDLQAVLKVPRALLERHRVLPIALSGDALLVATADPRNLFALEDLRLATGMRIQWVETPKDVLEAALKEVLNQLR